MPEATPPAPPYPSRPSAPSKPKVKDQSQLVYFPHLLIPRRPPTAVMPRVLLLLRVLLVLST